MEKSLVQKCLNVEARPFDFSHSKFRTLHRFNQCKVHDFRLECDFSRPDLGPVSKIIVGPRDKIKIFETLRLRATRVVTRDSNSCFAGAGC